MPVATTSANDGMEWLKIVVQVAGYIVTWVIVFTGWWVNNKQNKARDERKELRDQIGSIVDAVREVEANVVSYLTDTDGRTAASYWTVYFGVRQVNSSVVLYKIFNTDGIDKLLRAYRKAITDTAMPGPDAKPPIGAKLDSTLRTVALAGNGLVRGLEDRYRELYPLSQLKA